MPEPRKAVMIAVEASWADQSGTVRTIPARMEDKSSGGACIRIKKQIVVGAKLSVRSRWDQFVGIAKYCRSDGQEYLVGIQRELAKTAVLDPGDSAGRAPVRFQVVVRNSSAAVSTAKIATAPAAPRESNLDDVVAAKLDWETAPIVRIASVEAVMPPIAVTQAPAITRDLACRRFQNSNLPDCKKLNPNNPGKERERGKNICNSNGSISHIRTTGRTNPPQAETETQLQLAKRRLPPRKWPRRRLHKSPPK